MRWRAGASNCRPSRRTAFAPLRGSSANAPRTGGVIVGAPVGHVKAMCRQARYRLSEGRMLETSDAFQLASVSPIASIHIPRLPWSPLRLSRVPVYGLADRFGVGTRTMSPKRLWRRITVVLSALSLAKDCRIPEPSEHSTKEQDGDHYEGVTPGTRTPTATPTSTAPSSRSCGLKRQAGKDDNQGAACETLSPHLSARPNFHYRLCRSFTSRHVLGKPTCRRRCGKRGCDLLSPHPACVLLLEFLTLAPRGRG